jgi:hypothetical protein
MPTEDKARHLSWLPHEAGDIHIVSHVIAGLFEGPS